VNTYVYTHIRYGYICIYIYGYVHGKSMLTLETHAKTLPVGMRAECKFFEHTHTHTNTHIHIHTKAYAHTYTHSRRVARRRKNHMTHLAYVHRVFLSAQCPCARVQERSYISKSQATGEYVDGTNHSCERLCIYEAHISQITLEHTYCNRAVEGVCKGRAS